MRLDRSQRRIISLARTDHELKVLITNRIREPRNWHVRYALGRALLARGEYEAAAMEFAEACHRKPDSWAAATHYADCLLRVGHSAEFERWYASRSPTIAQKMRSFGSDERVTRIDGYHALQSGKPLAAYIHFSRNLAHSPDDVVSRFGRAAALEALDSPDEARFDRWAGLRATPPAQRNQDEVTSVRTSWETALSAVHFARLPSNWPDCNAESIRVQGMLAESPENQGVTALVVALATALDGDVAGAGCQAADLSCRYADWSASQRSLAARLVADAGEPTDAATIMCQASYQEPSSAYFAFRAMEVHWENDRSIAGLDLVPQSDEVCREIGDALDAANHVREATDFYREWSQQEGRLQSAVLLRLARCLKQLGKLAEARAAAEKAARLAPEHSDPLFALSQIAERERNHQQQAAHLRVAAQTRQQPATTFLQVSKLRDKAGDRDGALETLQQALSQYPDEAELVNAFSRLRRLSDMRDIAIRSGSIERDSPAAQAAVDQLLELATPLLQTPAPKEPERHAEFSSDLCEYQVYAERVLRSQKQPELYEMLGRILQKRGLKIHAGQAFRRANAVRLERSAVNDSVSGPQAVEAGRS
ncbi:MAG: tetratricopeptide repeat protein [Planctomycetaceae bacterium]